LFFRGTGAVLETRGVSLDDSLLANWRARADRARGTLGWPIPGAVARVHAAGASLAIAAPNDLLFLATEVNEWAWCASVQERDPAGWPSLEAGLLEEVLADAADPAAVTRQAEALIGVADAVNVTDNPTARVHMSAVAGAALVAKAGLEPVGQGLTLRMRQSFVVDASNAVDNADVAGFRQKRRFVDESPKCQQAVDATGILVVAENAAKPHHGTTSMSTRSCFPGSYRLRAFEEASRIRSISGSRAVAHRANPYNPPAMSSPARNE